MIVVSRSPGYVHRFHFRSRKAGLLSVSDTLWRAASGARGRERAGGGAGYLRCGVRFPAGPERGPDRHGRSRSRYSSARRCAGMNRASAKTTRLRACPGPDAPAMVAVHAALYCTIPASPPTSVASPRQGTPRRTADLCCPHATSLKECTALLRLSRYPLMPMALSCLMHGHHGP